MIAAVAYIAYKEYERQQQQEALYHHPTRQHSLGHQRDNNSNHHNLQRKTFRQRQRIQLRKQQRKYPWTPKKTRGNETNCHETTRTKVRSLSVSNGAVVAGRRIIEEVVSISPPLKRLSEINIPENCPEKNPAFVSKSLDFSPIQTIGNHDDNTTTMMNTSCDNPNSDTRVLSLDRDAFRDDVRAEWIRAVFGNKFPERDEANVASNNGTTSWKGVGLAGIPSYVTYTADLDRSRHSEQPKTITATAKSAVMTGLCQTDTDGNEPIQESSPSTQEKSIQNHPASPNGIEKETTPKDPPQPSLGMTLSRLSLGLYVRTVRQGSEAWCAGVEENSVLVGINDGELNLLAEPSKLALERIWQYEGCSFERSNDTSVARNEKRFDQKDTTNKSDGDAQGQSSQVGTEPKMKIRGPISMTFIRNGRLYKVVFLSDPPYGIDWAPCGKFCLIQRVKPRSIADLAGVRASSIVAAIYTDDIEPRIEGNDGSEQNTIYHLDHSSVATALKKISSSRIRMQLCFTPTQARSGHWERQQDALEDKGAPNSRASTKSNEGHNKLPQPTRPEIAAELDGVQVRIHPLLGAGGNLLGSSRRVSGPVSRRSLSPSSISRQRRITSGCVVSPSSMTSKLAGRVAAGELVSIWRSNNQQSNHNEFNKTGTSSSLGAEHGNFYRPCPILNNNLSTANLGIQQSNANQKSSSPSASSSPYILNCWSIEQAFIYVFCHHIAEYNEVKTRIRASEDTNFLSMLRGYLEQQIGPNDTQQIPPTVVLDALSTFLLFWLGWLTAKENKIQELNQYLLKVVHENQMKINARNRSFPNDVGGDKSGRFATTSSLFSLAHHMEFIAGSFDNHEMRISLQSLRKKRQQQQHLLENTHHSAIPEDVSMEGHSILPSIRAVTGTTPTNQGSSFQQKSSEKKNSRRLFKMFRKKKHKDGMKKNSSSPEHSAFHNGIVNTTSAISGIEITSPLPVAGYETITASNSLDSKSTSMILEELGTVTLSRSTDSLFANTMTFLAELDMVCIDIEKSLMRSFSQKFARWALQPWTPNKESVLAKVTGAMRERLERCNQGQHSMPLLDPIDSSSAPLLSIDTNGCYVLPSAHFPLLLTFDCEKKENPFPDHRNISGEEQMYRTSVELISLQGSRVVSDNEKPASRRFTVYGSVAGSIIASQQSVGIDRESNRHIWDRTNIMVFDSRSTWGAPRTLSLRLSQEVSKPVGKEIARNDNSAPAQSMTQEECGYCWVNLTPYWEQASNERNSTSRECSCKARVVPSDFFKRFDEHGDLPKSTLPEGMEYMVIELRIKTKILETNSRIKRSLLYKHDDDVRQEMFAIEFIKSCDRILQSCGLDLKMLTFGAIPVGNNRGFIEWVQGSVPLSEICQPFAGSILAKNRDAGKKVKSITIGNTGTGETSDDDDNDNESIALSSVAKAGVHKYESLKRVHTEVESLEQPNAKTAYVLPNNNNPIQDFLRSLAYDPEGPYKINRGVMDTYVKSVAGYSVCTYILGVGDRHLDNLLLHESGHFFHCDFSFILGQDPKKYLPMRITEDMINGMGGWKSDNFCQFLSLACATYLTLRRPENVRHLLSLIRLLEGCSLPDLEKTQSIGNAIQGVRDRLKLDLTDEQAIVFMEKLIEDSCASKMWIAVDAIHSLAQRF